MEIKFSDSAIELEKKLNRFIELIMITVGCSEETAKKCLERLMSNGLILKGDLEKLENAKERVFQEKVNFNDFWLKYIIESKNNKEWSSIQKEFIDAYFKAMKNGEN
ncbi:MAG: hypothetical protein KJ697_01880 [Nanoarchaeota archaeon]|nr:hypothetical protein [Nanoarchaeota archaeon]MBU4123900.1 hypothetical protein [Nanoarchaeota archaeon]